MRLLSVNCLFSKYDSSQAFTVEIPEMKNVSILKELIKEKNAHDLAHVDTKDLILYKISLSAAEVDAHLKEANTAVTCIHLPPLKKLKEVFLELLQENLVHIIFDYDSGTCLRH